MQLMFGLSCGGKLNFGKVQLMIFTKKAIYSEMVSKGCFVIRRLLRQDGSLVALYCVFDFLYNYVSRVYILRQHKL